MEDQCGSRKSMHHFLSAVFLIKAFGSSQLSLQPIFKSRNYYSGELTMSSALLCIFMFTLFRQMQKYAYQPRLPYPSFKSALNCNSHQSTLTQTMSYTIGPSYRLLHSAFQPSQTSAAKLCLPVLKTKKSSISLQLA
jgi:hypothetical protein